MIVEKLDNYPERVTVVAEPAEAQVIEDEKELDKRKEEAEKDIDVKLPLDGAPKAEKPDEPVVPDQIKLDENLFIQESMQQINENINEDNAARIIQEVISHKFGVDVDVATYKDNENSKCVIVEFIASKADCDKMVYDELKEELYKRFGENINISCKQFSSPNLRNKGTEYKLKLFVLKEMKDKSKIYGESLLDEKKNKPERSLWTLVYNELSKPMGNQSKQAATRRIKDVPNGDRYWDDLDDPDRQDIQIDGNDILVRGSTEEYLAFAKRVAQEYEVPYKLEFHPEKHNENDRYKIRLIFTDDQLPTEEEEEEDETRYNDKETDNWPVYSDEPNQKGGNPNWKLSDIDEAKTENDKKFNDWFDSTFNK